MTPTLQNARGNPMEEQYTSMSYDSAHNICFWNNSQHYWLIRHLPVCGVIQSVMLVCVCVWVGGCAPSNFLGFGCAHGSIIVAWLQSRMMKLKSYNTIPLFTRFTAFNYIQTYYSDRPEFFSPQLFCIIMSLIKTLYSPSTNPTQRPPSALHCFSSYILKSPSCRPVAQPLHVPACKYV